MKVLFIVLGLLLAGCRPDGSVRFPSDKELAMSNCVYQASRGGPVSGEVVSECRKFAEQVESAATAPLLARIAELEKDCDRFERYWN